MLPIIPTLTFNQPVVYDNTYGVCFDQKSPSFHPDHSDNFAHASKLIDAPTYPIPGIHHVVWHTHSSTVIETDLLPDLFQRVCWDIAYLKKMLNSIPPENTYAILILSKEISHDKSFKKYLENRMWFEGQVASRPPASLSSTDVSKFLAEPS